MASLRFYPALLLAVLAVASSDAQGPLDKVITLLQGLKTEVETEGKAEAETYGKFTVFVKEKTASTNQEIKDGKDAIQQLSKKIEVSTEVQAAKTSKMVNAKKEKEQLEGASVDNKGRCDRRAQEWEVNKVEMDKGLLALANAMVAVSKGDVGKAKTGALLAVRETLKNSVAAADALKVLDEDSSRGSATAFLQRGASSVDPNDPAYKFRSDGILSVLTNLKKELDAQRDQAEKEFVKAKKTCDETALALKDQLDDNAELISTLTVDLGDVSKQLATTKGELVEAKSALKDDELYLKDLTALADARAKDWAQRTAARAEEVKAIEQALDVLQKKAVAADVVNKRAMLLSEEETQGSTEEESEQEEDSAEDEGAGVSFLQLSSQATRVQEILAETDMENPVKVELLNLLQQESSRLHSATLAAMAGRAAASPFQKVKELIDQLVTRLEDEAAQEADKQAFCDTQMKKVTQERTWRQDEAQKLDAMLKQLEAKKSTLTIDIGKLKESVEALNKAAVKAIEQRAAEKKQNDETVAKAKEGQEAVAAAIKTLQEFYKKAAKAKSTALLQIRESPVLKDSPGAGFEGAYKGKQSNKDGIVGILQVVESDFAKTITTTTASEEKAQKAFAEFDSATKADIKGKSVEQSLKEEELVATAANIKTGLQDLKSTTDLVDKAIKELEELKPMCIDTGMTYEERAKKRDEELAALKQGLCILDTEGVEAACKK